MYACQATHAHIVDLIQAITKFESLANQIQKNAGDIDERLHMIESVRLFKQPPPRAGCDLPEAKVTSRHLHCIWCFNVYCCFIHRNILISKKATVMEFSTRLVVNTMPLVRC